MPKDEIDYSNTIFYKIYCKTDDVKDIYVGHTTNFVQRKYMHKAACNRDKCRNHNLKVYQFIREHGGWNNWKMDIVGFHECNDHYEARKVEQKYFETLHATLNSIEPLPKPKPKIIKEKIVPTSIPKTTTTWYCYDCKTRCQTEKQLDKHNETNKHKNKQLLTSNIETNITHKSPKTFECIPCDFICNNKKDYYRHLITPKHKIRINTNKIEQNGYKCGCGREYKHASSLWNHKQKCIIKNTISTEYHTSNSDSNNSALSLNTSDLVKYLIPLIKDLIIEIIPVLQPNHTDNKSYHDIPKVSVDMNTDK